MAITSQLDGKALANYIIRWLQYWFERNERDTAVIGISGGKDSAVVAALCKEALGAENVLGVLMPNGAQPDIEDSYAVCKELGIDYVEIPIGNPLLPVGAEPYGLRAAEYPFGSLIESIDETFSSLPNDNPFKSVRVSDAAKINIAPRLRMTTLYAVAQSLSSVGRHAAVVGTGNLGEAEVGYTTKWGDSACDVNPLRELWVDEVIAVGDALGYFPDIVHKTPSDGLCGQDDETRLGFSYADVKAVLDSNSPADTVDRETRAKVMAAHLRSAHKRSSIPHPERIGFSKSCVKKLPSKAKKSASC